MTQAQFWPLVLVVVLLVTGPTAHAGHGRCCGYYVAPTYAAPSYVVPTYAAPAAYAAPVYAPQAVQSFSFAAPSYSAPAPQIFVVPQNVGGSAQGLGDLAGLLGGKGGRILRCVLNEAGGGDLDLGGSSSDDSARLKRIEDKLDQLLGQGGKGGAGDGLGGNFEDPPLVSSAAVATAAAQNAALKVHNDLLKVRLEQQKALLEAQINALK